MLRFAPSPTGDMHIGSLRVALFNYLLSKQRNEPLIVRIEDTDKERNIEGKDQEILELLALFGIEHGDVSYQSNNLRFHRGMAIQLLQDKKAFNCFCTPSELEQKRELAEKSNKPFRYDDKCRFLPAEMTIDNLNPFTIRLGKPGSAIEVEDIIKGKCSFGADDIDSFIIMNAEKLPTCDFACAVDDMISDVSLIIRGEDHLESTPKEIAVRNALGYEKKIEYAHLPLILNEVGEKMSRRDDAFSVKWLLEEGYLREAISNYLILIGNKTPNEVFSVTEALEWFDLASVSNSPARFDIDKLKSINRQHMRQLDAKELSRYVGFADDEIGNLAKVFLEEAGTLKELRSKIRPLFEPKVIPEAFAESAQKLAEVIKAAPYFDDFKAFESHTMQASGLKEEQFFTTLRLLLTGAEQGPELANLYPHIKNYIGEIVK